MAHGASPAMQCALSPDTVTAPLASTPCSLRGERRDRWRCAVVLVAVEGSQHSIGLGPSQLSSQLSHTVLVLLEGVRGPCAYGIEEADLVEARV